MDWLNIHTSTLDSAEVIGAEPIERATWLFLLRYCTGQENGGVIKDCSDWGDRKWQQIVRVTQKEVKTPSALWSWAGADLHVNFYPIDKQREVESKRKAGRLTVEKRWGKQDMLPIGSALSSADSSATSSAITLAKDGADSSACSSAISSASCSADTEGKGREGNTSAKSALPPVAGGRVVNFDPSKPPDPCFEALAKACGRDPGQMTKRDDRACRVALAEIKRVHPDVQPAEFTRRAERYRVIFREAAITPSALCAHWAACGDAVRPTAVVREDEPANWRARIAFHFPDATVLSDHREWRDLGQMTRENVIAALKQVDGSKTQGSA